MTRFKNKYTLIILIIFFIIGVTVNLQAQNQKVWNGNTSVFRIDTTVNLTSVVTWSYTLGFPSTSSRVDGGGARKGTTTITWGNTTAAMFRDTIKSFETVNGCSGNIVNKPIDVYPKPIVSLGANDTICLGATLGTKTLTVSNFSVIGGASNLGEFAITYELRSGSTAGVNVLGFPVTLNTTSGIISITSIPSSSLPAGTYFLVLTGFASNVSATLNNPAPGSYARGNASATLAAIPTNYLINIRPNFSTPAIQPY